MSAIVLTLVVGVFNLFLGYVVAVRLGYGPPSLLDSWEVLRSYRPRNPANRTDRRQPAAAAAPAEAIGGQQASASIEELLDEPDEEPFDEPLTGPCEPPDEEPYLDLEDERTFEEANPEGLEIWDLNEKFVETSVLKLNIAMMRSGAKNAQIDARLRAVQGRSDRETIQRCLAELLEDCRTYLAEQEEAAGRFRRRIGELGELSALGEQIEMASLQQAAQIETTINNLQFMDFESDLEAANRRLLDEIRNLRVARHKLRDDQEKAFLVIARYEHRIEKIESRLFNDPLTKLRNRVGLENALWQWWQQGRHRSRPMSAVLFDLDGFGRLNEEHGPTIGDRILAQLAQYLEQAVGEADLVGRFAGQRFLVMMLDAGPRAATKSAELIRQSVEKFTFRHGDEEIGVTMTAAITEVTPEDTHEALFARLEKALWRAKQAGPNHAVFHDGQQADLIESPNLGATSLEISI